MMTDETTQRHLVVLDEIRFIATAYLVRNHCNLSRRADGGLFHTEPVECEILPSA